MTIEIPQAPGFDLCGKRALVVGASRGIGLAAAAAMAQAGAEVTAAARSLGACVSNAYSDLLPRNTGRGLGRC